MPTSNENRGSRAHSESGRLRLDSWKQIATHLGRDVRTAQRWEKREGLPVHRHVHEKAGSVHAFVLEIDAWRQGRTDMKQLNVDRSKVAADNYSAKDALSQQDWLLIRKLLEAIHAQLAQMSNPTRPVISDALNRILSHAIATNRKESAVKAGEFPLAYPHVALPQKRSRLVGDFSELNENRALRN